jgi:hypothetical protein
VEDEMSRQDAREIYKTIAKRTFLAPETFNELAEAEIQDERRLEPEAWVAAALRAERRLAKLLDAMIRNADADGVYCFTYSQHPSFSKDRLLALRAAGLVDVHGFLYGRAATLTVTDKGAAVTKVLR